MDTISSSRSAVQQRSPTKINKSNHKKKKKQQSIKVVYISNPMKVNTSASQFRALVQELTGQYAESPPPDPSRFQVPGSGGSSHRMEYCNELVVPPPVDPEGLPNGGSSSSSIETLDYDDVFTPQMVDNISVLLDHW